MCCIQSLIYSSILCTIWHKLFIVWVDYCAEHLYDGKSRAAENTGGPNNCIHFAYTQHPRIFFVRARVLSSSRRRLSTVPNKKIMQYVCKLWPARATQTRACRPVARSVLLLLLLPAKQTRRCCTGTRWKICDTQIYLVETPDWEIHASGVCVVCIVHPWLELHCMSVCVCVCRHVCDNASKQKTRAGLERVKCCIMSLASCLISSMCWILDKVLEVWKLLQILQICSAVA